MTAIRLAKSLFNPDSVALIGASSDMSKPNGRPLKYLLKHGYGGKIYPVNPRGGEIQGVKCYDRLASVPGPVDHAFVLLSGDEVPQIVRDCADFGVTCVTVLAGGFSEVGALGRRRQAELLNLAKSVGVRLLGPNSIGLVNPKIGLALSANAMLELPQLTVGRAAAISQSGSLIGALLSHGEARKTGFSKLVSVGNEADLSVGEIGDLLLDDDDTDVVLLFLETLRDGARLAAFARRAHKFGKPVIAYRVGRTEVGRELTQSHTGALATPDKSFATFLAHHGIAEVNMLDSLSEAPRLFSGRRAPESRGETGVAIVTTTGGGGAMIVDNLALRGVRISKTPESVVARLALSGVEKGASHLVDLTMAGAKPEIVQGVIEDLVADPSVGAVVMVVGSSARFHPDLAVSPLLPWAGAAKPVVVYLVPDAEESLLRLARAGVPVFRSPEVCADALRALMDWRAPRTGPEAGVPDRILPNIEGEVVLGELTALQLFAAIGIDAAVGEIAQSTETAAQIAGRIGYPVVVKIASADIPHKSEVGGVHLNIGDVEELNWAFRTVMASAAKNAPTARIDGVMIQRAHRGLAEVIVGFKRDPSVGPLIVLGIGGVLAELYKDVSVRIAPVSLADAGQMIREVVGLALVRGYRNLPLGDMSALARSVVAMSTLANEGGILEAEINPLIVGPDGDGVIAVDGLVVFGPSRSVAAAPTKRK